MAYIEIDNLSKVINNNTVLQNISLEMERGKIYGLRGINGSGKTMLMRTILGLIRPSGGSVSIGGKQLGKEIEFPESVGFLLEMPSFLDRYSGLENLKMLASIQGKIGEEKIRETLEEVGLNPQDKKKYKKYSLGMKQRLGIGAAIMEEPDLVILDEPTNALDASGIELVQAILMKQKSRGALVIVSCHDHVILEAVSDEIIKLENGRMV